VGLNNYYNENDPDMAQWLRNLRFQGRIPQGIVDERDIREINHLDVRDATQFHAFAGISGWCEALRLAGWPANVSVWTGSPPCQPFSNAGRRKGARDERHLFPAWANLIAKCRPPVIFGEQVASVAGRKWLTTVRLTLEALGYAVGAADLCAASVGAPHVRQRLYWVANTDDERCESVHAQLREGPAQHDLPQVDWGSTPLLEGRDGIKRPIEPSAFPLVDRTPNRMVRLRGYGNAIVPMVGAAFIKAWMQVPFQLNFKNQTKTS
jgi:DNA (cytosine-5)-methyltransferase 1